jgi:putative ABC transport system permease protein
MIRNYIKIAYRNLLKYRLFSFINIVGLAIAIPFALLALLQLQGSFEFDNFHKDSDRIFRIITDQSTDEGAKKSYASSPYLLADKLKKDYPSIENATKVLRVFGWELNNRLKSDDVNALFVEPSFFEMFNFPLAAGSLPVEPNTLVISHESAIWYFGDSNPIGKVLNHATHGTFKITGVLKKYKPKTQFKADVMLSMASYLKIHPIETDEKSWAGNTAHTFVKLQPKVEADNFQKSLLSLATETNKILAKEKVSDNFRLQKFADISPAIEELEFDPYVEDKQDIMFNFSIPLLILLLAGFNYTNLTLARSLSRSREVGVRKVMGALRVQLVLQFLCEAVIISFAALALGMFFLWIIKNNVHVAWLTWEVDNPYTLVGLFTVFALFLGILAGILPAWILSGFQPVKVLKGSLSPASFGKIGFRKSLIVIQFVVTIAFIFQIGHLISQFNYMATEEDNYSRKDLFNLPLLETKNQALHSEISQWKDVEKVGYTSQIFGNQPSQIAIKANVKSENQAAFYYAADAAYIDNMKLKFVAGQNLPTTAADSAAAFVLVNQEAVRRLRLGSPAEAIGKQLFLGNKAVQIQGVLENFCHFNYQFAIQPLVFQYNPASFHIMALKTQASIDRPAFESQIKAAWKKQFPYQEAYGNWLDTELYNRYYPAEDMKIMGLASLVIFVIAIMGLIGILTYTTEKRLKEIGIRKVMGAGIPQIVKTVSWGFIKLLLIATAIALPIGLASGYFFTHLFVFNDGVNFGYMFGFVIVIVGIALATVTLFSYKAALMNPVKSLKTE